MKNAGTLIPGGCTKCTQASDVVWNGPFRGQMVESCDAWVASGLLHYTETGNLKPVSRRLVVDWSLESYNRLDGNLIIESFKSCILNLKIVGSKDR